MVFLSYRAFGFDMLVQVGTPVCAFYFGGQFKGTSGSLKAEGLDDAISKPVIIITSIRVGVISPWPNKKQFRASDQKQPMVFRRFSFFSRRDNNRDRA
jgi:hypothetical protein